MEKMGFQARVALNTLKLDFMSLRGPFKMDVICRK
jgi:hypothetical protein